VWSVKQRAGSVDIRQLRRHDRRFVRLETHHIRVRRYGLDLIPREIRDERIHEPEYLCACGLIRFSVHPAASIRAAASPPWGPGDASSGPFVTTGLLLLTRFTRRIAKSGTTDARKSCLSSEPLRSTAASSQFKTELIPECEALGDKLPRKPPVPSRFEAAPPG
jgi:hypothetical protein